MTTAPTYRELLSTIRAWVKENCPGCVLDFVEIHCLFHGKHIHPVVLTDGPCAPSAEPSSSPGDEKAIEDERGTDRSNGLSGCLGEILQTLKDVGSPLTATLLKRQMAVRGFIWDERTIKRYLAVLMEDGTIENPAGARPSGYRLVSPDLFDSGD